jgi:hypothetical protein
MLIGFHASHEQFPPSELLTCTVEAERAGFACAMPRITSSHGRHARNPYAAWLAEFGELGFDRLFLHQVDLN